MNDSTPTPASPVTDVGGAFGRRRFLAGAGAVVGAATAGSFLPVGFAEAETPAGAGNFHILDTAVRLADTRSPGAYDVDRVNDRRIRVRVGGVAGVPDEATGAVFTVTAVNWGDPNHVTVFPTGQALPLASNLNTTPWAVNANMVTVKLGSTGSIDVESLMPCDLIVDVLGYYQPVDGAVRAGRFVSLDTPRRAYDSRELTAGGPLSIIPDDSFTTIDVTAETAPTASAVVLNLTATECTRAGHFSVVPEGYDGPPPSTSSLNASAPGDTRASAVVCPITTIGGRRRIKVYSIFSAHLIVDVAGYYTGESAALSQIGLFVPLAPTRIKDTRAPGEIGRLWPGWIVEAPLPAAIAGEASAVAMNVTGVESRAAGYLTVTAARQKVPFVSNVNWTGPWAVVPNHVISAATDTHGVQVYSSHGAHVVCDLNGYFTGTPKTPRLAAPQNPAPPAAPPDWVLRVPKIGLTSTVKEGVSGVVTDSGYSWHWSGTGYLGQDGAHIASFAHRTTAGGPYRNIHLLDVGDIITLTTLDAREFTYRMVRRDLTDSNNANILDAVRSYPTDSFSLVACTVGHDRSKSAWPNIWAPTSLKYRIVVTFELVGWREI